MWIHGSPRLEAILSLSPLGQLVRSRLGPAARPVRAILFDKTPEANWALAWHQDRTIAVRQRHQADGFDRWTVKARILHVEQPFKVLERMVTARIHLDPVDEENARLLVAVGSHRAGRVA